MDSMAKTKVNVFQYKTENIYIYIYISISINISSKGLKRQESDLRLHSNDFQTVT